MQALAARQAAFCSSGSAGRRPAARSRRAVTVRADVGFCRDKISQPQDLRGQIEGTSVVVFLGADGQEVPVECPKGGYILDAGLDAGLELPYTCRGGICGCCVGRIASGEVDDSDIADLTFVLTPDEIENGLTMLCMSRPVSDVVYVETQSNWGYNLGSNDWQGPTGYIAGKSIDPLMGRRWEEIQQEAAEKAQEAVDKKKANAAANKD
ncbi:chloroplast precursor [Chlorella sorokiniana]|jgi:ferredoxin|uniref:Chloroplast n=1 Tax=Chlorella sorokiniana TaxID=3076 RepID=A0A2P6TT33_CHLSO|nr:chloroplast precursor [Chlorella sorokiniana]|eukprot:PRW57228.1 chloroplast precursor [Chlorella sorokiniana]